MSGITLETAQAQLDIWIAASAAVAANQSYAIGNRALTRVNATEIRKQIDKWQNWVIRLTSAANGRGRTRYVVLE